MPEKDYVWLPRADILDFEEVGLLVDVFAGLGVDRVRLTGGEPLVRRDLPQLVRVLAAKSRIRDLALTTNGVLLADQAAALRAAGLHRVTVSLDTLRPDRFHALTRFDELARVLSGIAAASTAGFAALKIDTVVIRGQRRRAGARSWSTVGASAPKCASSNTWTSAERHAGRETPSFRAPKSSSGSAGATVPSSPSSRRAPLRPSASVCRTEPFSVSSLR